MLIRMISGRTRVCGKAQGYPGLPIRDIRHRREPHDGKDAPAMQTAWEPTPDELSMLNRGGSIIVTILGTQPPPMDVGVEHHTDLTNPYVTAQRHPPKPKT